MAVEYIDYSKCTHCGLCYEACPTDVFKSTGGYISIAYLEDCISCFLCELDCPEDCVPVRPERPWKPVFTFP